MTCDWRGLLSEVDTPTADVFPYFLITYKESHQNYRASTCSMVRTQMHAGRHDSLQRLRMLHDTSTGPF
jgi:hypothetical protein